MKLPVYGPSASLVMGVTPPDQQSYQLARQYEIIGTPLSNHTRPTIQHRPDDLP